MSTHQLAGTALDRWNADMQHICGHFETELAFNRSLFIGEISTWSRGGLALANLRTNAGLIRRDGIKPDRDNDQHCFLVSQRTGFSQVTQNGVSVQLAPGEMLLMDAVEGTHAWQGSRQEALEALLGLLTDIRDLDQQAKRNMLAMTCGCLKPALTTPSWRTPVSQSLTSRGLPSGMSVVEM